MSRPDLSVTGRRNIWVPVGATLVGVEIKPNLAEPKQSEDEKLHDIHQSEGIHESKEQVQKHLKIQQRKSKQNQPRLQSAQYQLAGEMLAAALHNYQTQPRKTSYTIFGVRVIGMHSILSICTSNLLAETRMAFYRADFPREYLESVTSCGYPDGDITIFR